MTAEHHDSPSFRAEIAAAEKAAEAREKRWNNVENGLDRLGASLETMSAQLARVEEQTTKTNGTVATVVSDLEAQKRRVGELGATVSDLTGDLSEVAGDVEGHLAGHHVSVVKAGVVEEQVEAKRRWWNGIKLRLETVLALLGIAGGAWALFAKSLGG